MSYLKRHGARRVPQSAPIAGSGQAPSSAVGFDTATPQLISDFVRGAL